MLAYEGILRYGMDVWWISPIYKMSSVIWRTFRRDFKNYASWISGADRIIEMPMGNTLTVWSADNFDTMRGGAPHLVVIDEAAMIRGGEEMWFGVIRPALTDHQGRAVFLSSPRGRNWFWKLFNMGIDPLFPDYKSWNFPSWMRPNLIKSEIDEARLSLPQRFFEQEYEAKFLDDAGGVFRGVDEVATLSNAQPAGQRTIMGVDWGKINDFTAISVFDADTREQLDLDRFNQIGWSQQRGKLKRMYEKWKPEIIWAEANSIGEVNIEALQEEGLPVHGFTTTGASKGPLIEGLALAIERQELKLLNDRVQTAELQAYEIERTSANNWRYSAPDGAHDDTVIATALAWYGITTGTVGAVITLTRQRK